MQFNSIILSIIASVVVVQAGVAAAPPATAEGPYHTYDTCLNEISAYGEHLGQGLGVFTLDTCNAISCATCITMAILGCAPGYLEFLGTPETGARKCYTDYVTYCKIPMAHPTSFPFTCPK